MQVAFRSVIDLVPIMTGKPASELESLSQEEVEEILTGAM